MNYDFKQLSPHEFELLTQDLLQADWKLTFECFKQGKDCGIDLRYAKTNSNIIIQCKHYAKTGINGLLQTLREELSNIQRLKPQRYVVVTSVSMSPYNKDKVVETLGDSVISVSDVLGAEDLNNMLRRHPEVEQIHYKLWLSSIAVFNRVLHNASLTNSEFKVKEVYEDIRRYVQSETYDKAMECIAKNNVVILSGSPGIGKTTLANLLLYEHLEQDFQPIVLYNIEECFNLFQHDCKQIYYIDDFLGTTFLSDSADVISNNRDQKFINFVQAIRSTPNKKLVLTTREHILSQAKSKSEILKDGNLEIYQVTLHMSGYTLEQRAQILYNHIYFSDLPEDFVKQLLKDEFYLHIVHHPKFNPRIIRWISSYSRVGLLDSKDYRTFIKDLLADPSKIWLHAYEHQVSDSSRTILLALFSLNGHAEVSKLEKSFSKLHLRRSEQYKFITRPEDFSNGLRELVGSLVLWDHQDHIQFIDPSIRDLMNAIVAESSNNSIDIVLAAHYFDQIASVWKLANTVRGKYILEQLVLHYDEIYPKIASSVFEFDISPYHYENSDFLLLERRFIIVSDLSNTFKTSEFQKLWMNIFRSLSRIWLDKGLTYEEVQEKLEVIKQNKSLSINERRKCNEVLRKSFLVGLENVCYSDDLVGAREMFDDFNITDQQLSVISKGFDIFKRDFFDDELRACQSVYDFDSFIDRLFELRDLFEDDVDDLIWYIDERKDEFLRYQSELEQRAYEERKDLGFKNVPRPPIIDTQDKLRNLFGSLVSTFVND